MAYLFFILFKVFEGLFLFPLQLVFFLPAYILKHQIEKHPTLFKWLILYWFTNMDESIYVNRWWGVYELVEDDVDGQGNVIKDKYLKFQDYNSITKFFMAFNWMCFRNFAWMARVTLSAKFAKGILDPKSVKEIKPTIGSASPTTWRNKTIFGYQFITYKLINRKTLFFRYSFTRELKKLSPFRLFGFNYINVMAGYEQTGRIIIKLRCWK